MLLVQVNSGRALSMTLNFYTSVAKVLKLKVRKISELIPTFLKVTEKKLVGGGGGGDWGIFAPHL